MGSGLSSGKLASLSTSEVSPCSGGASASPSPSPSDNCVDRQEAGDIGRLLSSSLGELSSPGADFGDGGSVDISSSVPRVWGDCVETVLGEARESSLFTVG